VIIARLNVILGFLVIVGLHYIRQATPAITACVVILIGLVTASLVIRKKVRNVGDAADSLYFLGFVATIVSLYVAFSKIAGEASFTADPQAVVKQLFGTIGSGLSTTIAGLIMREFVYLIGSRQPEVTIDNVTDNHIQSVVEKLNAALALGTEAVEVSRLAAGSADAYRQTFDAYSVSLAEYDGTLKSFKSDVAEPLSELKDKLAETMSALVGQVGAIATSLTEVEAGLNSTSRQLNELAVLLPGLAKDVPRSFDEMRKATNGAADSIDRLVQTTNSMATSLDRDFDDVEAIARALPEVAAGMNGLSAGARDLANAGPTMSALEKQMISFAGSVPAAFGQVTKNSSELGDQIADLTARLDGLLSTLNRDYQNLQIIADRLPAEHIWKPIEYLGDMMPSLNKHLKSSAQTLEEASQRLDSTSRAFAESQRLFAAYIAVLEQGQIPSATARSGGSHHPPTHADQGRAPSREPSHEPTSLRPANVVPVSAGRPKDEVIVPKAKRGIGGWLRGK
jgi:methyl-accepting chemotaxis protein